MNLSLTPSNQNISIPAHVPLNSASTQAKPGQATEQSLPTTVQFDRVTPHDVPSRQDLAAKNPSAQKLEDEPVEESKSFVVKEMDEGTFVAKSEGGTFVAHVPEGTFIAQSSEGTANEQMAPDQAALMKIVGKPKDLNAQIADRDARINENPNAPIAIADKFALENPAAYRAHREMVRSGTLIGEIAKREKEMEISKAQLQPIIDKNKRSTPDLRCRQLYRNLESSTATIQRVKGGQGGAYRSETIVVKPKGEGICEAHNAKGNAYVTLDNCCRDTIPLYHESEREAASYDIAVHLNLKHITPPTILAIVKNDSFSHFTDRLGVDVDVEKMKEKLPKITEKVCSVQANIPNCGELKDMMPKWEKKARDNLQDKLQKETPGSEFTEEDFDKYFNEYLASIIDFDNLEDCNVLQWFTGENDGNLGNFLVVEKPLGKFGLIKIDNGLTYPEKNQDFDNGLNRFLHAQCMGPISQRAKQIIMDASPKKMEAILKDYALDGTIDAMLERTEVMKKIIEEFPDISHAEMDQRLAKLQYGRNKALEDFSADELKKLKEEGLDFEPAQRKGRGSLVQRLKGNFSQGTTSSTALVKPPQRKTALATEQRKTQNQQTTADEIEAIRRQQNFRGLRDIFNK